MLVTVAEAFYRQGGRYLFLDEVHKYERWAQHIKNLYDFYPDLNIIFTGSSILDISREEGDLSRRARMYELKGLSYREYLAIKNIINIPAINLENILQPSFSASQLFPTDFRPLEYFHGYLKEGYYPFFLEDAEGYGTRVQQLVRLIIEYDMAELNDFDIRNAKKLLRLLYILATNVPFKPNISSLAQKSNIHRNTINSYLHFLEQARLIKLMYAGGNSVAVLQKPEKIYLDNSNLAFALTPQKPDTGNLRETFFLNQVSSVNQVSYPANGDFLVDGKWLFEIGGLHKDKTQIKGIENSFLVRDDVAFPVGGSLPLWIFGFLY